MLELFDKFGIKANSAPWDGAEGLPYFLTEMYDLQKVILDGMFCIFATPISETPTIQAITKHFSSINAGAGLPVVLKTNGLSGERRKALIEARIPFVATEQIYLPFIGVAMQERLYDEPKSREKLMPSAQLLLFAYLYQENDKMHTSKMAKQLEISGMQITRAVRQLQKLNLFEVGKEGVNVVISGKTNHWALFETAKPYLIDPVREILYVDRSEQIEYLPLSGLDALSEMSMLAAPMVTTRAYFSRVDRINGENALTDREKQVRIEVCKYSPSVLSKQNHLADPLSVIVSLADEQDVRVDQAIEQVLKNMWGE